MNRAARRLAIAWALLPAVALAAAHGDPWLRIQSAHFELFTDAGERAGRDLVRHFEQVRGFFLLVFGLQSSNGKPVRTVAFRNEKEFQPYRPSEAASAFYHAGSEHDYIVMSSTDAEHYQVATHEYTHLLLGQAGGTVPLWLNEGLAELYSTAEQVGDKIVIGQAPPGRGEALLENRWIPLAALLSTGPDSPLYNEKSRAGMFYAESWALLHMLNLDPQYRLHLRDLLDALKTADSVAAFERTYGKSVAQVQADLQAYVGRQYLHGLAFQIPLEKAVESPEIETNAGMRARLALAELLADYPGKVAQAAAMYSQLARDFPQSWEVEAALGRFAWRERRDQAALGHFERAAGLGGPGGRPDARMFLDYARALGAANRSADAVAALRNALRLDASLKEAHYDLGLALVRTGDWRSAMAELQLARPLKPFEAPQYFYCMAYSAYRLGDTIVARNYLEQGRPYTKIPEEVAALDRLSGTLGPPVVEGVLDAIECQGKLARLHVRVGDSRRIFLIPDFTLAKDLQCGPQPDVAVRIEFQAMLYCHTLSDYLTVRICQSSLLEGWKVLEGLGSSGRLHAHRNPPIAPTEEIFRGLFAPRPFNFSGRSRSLQPRGRGRPSRSAPPFRRVRSTLTVFSQHGQQTALYLDIRRGNDNRLERGISRLEPDRISRLAINPLESSIASRHQRDHDIAVSRIGDLLQQDDIAIADVIVDHGIAAHFQRVGAGAAAHIFGDVERLALFHRLQGGAGSYPPAQGNLALRFAALHLRHVFRGEFQRTALIKAAFEVVLGLQDGNVFVHGGERG
jgi:tetratricopeptide (TPR) repeat protein